MALSWSRTNNRLHTFFTRLSPMWTNPLSINRNIGLVILAAHHFRSNITMCSGHCGIMCIKQSEKNLWFHTASRRQFVKDTALFHELEVKAKVTAMNNLKNTDKMLNQLEDISNGGLSIPTEVAMVVNQLRTTLYKELAQNHKWLQTSDNIAYIQLVLENKVESFTSPIIQNSNFPLLYSLLEEHYMNFSNEELAKSLLSMVYLGMSPTDSLTTNMYLECRSRIPTFDIVALSISSYVHFGGKRDFVRTRAMINRWKELMNDPSLVWTKEVLQGHCSLGSKFSHIVSLETLQKACGKVLKVLDGKEMFLQDPELIGNMLRFAQYAFRDQRRKQFLPREIITKAADLCPGVVDEFEANQIAETCSALKSLVCYGESLALMFEQRAFELLTDECALRDVSNLIHVLSKYTTKYVRSKFMQKLYTSLLVTQPDLILLSNISENLTLMKQRNLPKNIQGIFLNSVTERANNIINSDTRYRKITRYLIQSRILETEQKAVFERNLTEQLEIMIQVITQRKSAKYCAFLLTIIDKPLSLEIFTYLLKEIDRWTDANPYYLLLEGIISMPKPISDQLQLQIDEIQTALFHNLEVKMNDTLCLDDLFLFVRYLLITNRNRDPLLTEKMMQLFLKFTISLIDEYNAAAVERITALLSDFRYQFPQLFEDLASIVIKHQDTMAPNTIISVLTGCANIVYIPKKADEFTRAVLKAYNMCKEEDSIVQMLNILYQLSMLEIFPENELEALFTIDNMERIDQFLTEKPEYKHDVENLMLALNRTVVLECPQLDVPWFHSRDIIEGNLKVPKQTKFSREVADCLAEAIGGKNLIQSPSFSHYGHPISFEILVDSKRQLIPAPSSHQKISTEVRKRIAIQVYDKKHYCFSSRDMIGSTQTIKRQLEIMGYQVIQIPNFEWFGLRYPHSKLDYIHGKLFGPEGLITGVRP